MRKYNLSLKSGWGKNRAETNMVGNMHIDIIGGKISPNLRKIKLK